MRVMVVDDSKTMRKIIINTLSQLGYTEVEEACDGTEATEKVSSFHPEFILLDWNMPNMDGLAFVKGYRKMGHRAPVIMVTTEAEKPRVIEAIKAGVNNYVVKPFTPDALMERIQETLAKAQAKTT